MLHKLYISSDNTLNLSSYACKELNLKVLASNTSNLQN